MKRLTLALPAVKKKVLIKKHFPDCELIRQEKARDIEERRSTRLFRLLAGSILQIRWVTNGFFPYKTIGGVKIIPVDTIRHWNYSTEANWFCQKQLLNLKPNEVFFILEAENTAPDLELYKYKSLSSFFIQTMKRLVAQYVRIYVERFSKKANRPNLVQSH